MVQKPARGFVTIATGNESYYRIARNLLRSYRMNSSRPLPFALIADRENQYTKEFDQVCLLPDAAYSYLDKLRLADMMPFDITIFIDADCLAYGNLNCLFDVFAQADDVSCFGRVLPLDDLTGWFDYNSLRPELQSRISYVVGLHGGIYYLRKGKKSREVFAQARELVKEYDTFQFKGRFTTPGDEPVLALSMALHGCRPIPFTKDAICCYWEHEGSMELDFAGHTAALKVKPNSRYLLVHWGTRFTQSLEYREQICQMRIMMDGAGHQKQRLERCRRVFRYKRADRQIRRLAGRVRSRIRRALK